MKWLLLQFLPKYFLVPVYLGSFIRCIMISGCRTTRKGLSRHFNSSIKRAFLSFSLNLLAHALDKTRACFISGRASILCLNTHPGLHQSPLCPEASSACCCSFPGSWMGKWIGVWKLLGWTWLFVSKASTGSCRTLLQSFSLTLSASLCCPCSPTSYSKRMCPMGHH